MIFCPKFPTLTATTNKSNTTLKIVDRKVLERQSNEGVKLGIYRDLDEELEEKIKIEKSLKELPFLVRSDTPTSQIILAKYHKLQVEKLKARELEDKTRTDKISRDRGEWDDKLEEVERDDEIEVEDDDGDRTWHLTSSLTNTARNAYAPSPKNSTNFIIKTRSQASPSTKLKVESTIKGIDTITDLNQK